MHRKLTRAEPVTPMQALEIAILLLEFEAENVTFDRGHRDPWACEVRESANILSQLKETLSIAATN